MKLNKTTKILIFLFVLTSIAYVASNVYKIYAISELNKVKAELNSVEANQFLKKTQMAVCNVKKDFPCAWDSHESCVNVEGLNQMIAHLEKSFHLEASFKEHIENDLAFHKKRNEGEMWSGPEETDLIEKWKSEHPQEGEPPENLGKLHWMDGYDDAALQSLMLLMNLCESGPSGPVKIYAADFQQSDEQVYMVDFAKKEGGFFQMVITLHKNSSAQDQFSIKNVTLENLF